MPESALAPPSPAGIHQLQLQPGHPESAGDLASTSSWDTAGQAGIRQSPPTGMSRVRLRPAHTAGGGCAKGAESPGTHRQRGGVRHAPAQPHSPDWSRLLRRRCCSAGTAAGSAQRLQHRMEPPAWHPRHPQSRPAAPPSPVSPEHCVATSGHAVCWGSLPLATFRRPRHREPARRLCWPDRLELSGNAWHSRASRARHEPRSFGESRKRGMGMKQGARRGLSALGAWGMSPILPHSEVFPHPK